MKDLLRRWLADGNGRAAVADFLDAVNEELPPVVGEHLLIGPSHFMRADLSQNALRRIWMYYIFPLIEEQLWGDQDRIGHWRWEQVRERYGLILAGKAPREDTGPEAPTCDDESPGSGWPGLPSSSPWPLRPRPRSSSPGPPACRWEPTPRSRR